MLLVTALRSEGEFQLESVVSFIRVIKSSKYYPVHYFVVIFRFFRQFILLFIVHVTSISMFRSIASVFQTVVASMTVGSMSILVLLLFGGFIVPKGEFSHTSSGIRDMEL